jgi:hypothetical protein
VIICNQPARYWNTDLEMQETCYICDPMKKTVINSLPKSGTNLVIKCLQLFAYRYRGHIDPKNFLIRNWPYFFNRITWRLFKQRYQIGIGLPVNVAKWVVDRKLTKVREMEFVTMHVGNTTELLDSILASDFAAIVITRDPRAVLSSHVHYVMEKKSHRCHHHFASMGLEDRYLTSLIGFSAGGVSLASLRDRCLAMEPWIASGKVLHIKFEDLVGSRGGSSDELQWETLQRICDWLGLSTDPIDYVAKNLFGPGLPTFRKGQVDSWEHEVPPKIREIAAEQLADVLDDWGYQSN